MSDIRCTVTLKLVTEDPGIINITYDFDFPDHLNGFAFTIIDGWNGIRTRGFNVNGRTCKWTGSNESNQSIHIDYGVNDGPGTTGYVDTGEWAITRLPNISCQWSYNATGPSPELINQYHISGKGAVSSDGAVAYLGPHNEYVDTAPGTGEEFRLVIPNDAELRDDPDSILSALTKASESLEIGAVNGSVLAIAAPTGGYRWASKGRQRGDCGFWVRDDAVTGETNETWVHEYVHTRQLFRRTDETYWFNEGTADYFASLAALNRSDIDFNQFHGFLTQRADSGAVLADPNTWSSKSTAYRQGRRTCAALDCRIRDATGGEATLMDVFSQLNEDSDADDPLEVSNRMIHEAVKTVTGTDISDWFDKYVRAARAPPVPKDQRIFALQGGHPKPEPTPEPEPEPVHCCPVCDTETTDRLCPTCGHDLGPASEPPKPGARQTCPVCDTGTTDRLCPTCGHEIKSPTTDGEPTSEPPDPNETKACPTCGTKTTEQLCPTCGHDLAPRCPVCDAVGTPHDEYCATCGHDLRS